MYQTRWRRTSWSVGEKPEREKFPEFLIVMSAVGRNSMFVTHAFVCIKAYRGRWEE